MPMKMILLALILSLLVVAALTPVARVLAFRLGAVSHPGGRHIHEKAIPRLGGLAICVGFFVGVGAVSLLLVDPFHHVRLRMLCLLVGGCAMCAIGLVDDTRGIRASRKLLLHLVVAVFSYACGFRITNIHVPLLGDIDAGMMALPLTALWIVTLVNAINLIDGLDGLAAGVVFFAATTNLIVACLNGTPLVAWLSAAIAGSVLGFLFYNFNPARIFMGDSGSYFLGYVLSITALIGTQKKSTAVSLLVPILALGVPIFDTLFAMVRRILERRSVFSPDRGHIHHRLLDMGLTHRRAVILIYAVCAVFTAAAIGVSLDSFWQVGMALFMASVALIGLVRFVGYFDYFNSRFRQRARLRSRDTEMLRQAIPRLPLRLADAASEAEILRELWRFAGEAQLSFIELSDTRPDPQAAAPPSPAGYDGGDPQAPGPAGHEAGDSQTAEPLQAKPSADEERCVHRWASRASLPAGAARDMLTVSYPLGGDGSARFTVLFGWYCEFGDVPPQSEILLQIAADLLTQHLARVRSRLVVMPERQPLSEPPDVLAIPARPSQV